MEGRQDAVCITQTPSLLWCYRLFYSEIPEVVSVLFSQKKVSFVCTKGRNTQKKLSLRKTCGRFPECFLGGGAEKTQRDELEDDMHITCFVSLCGAEHSTPRTTIPKREVSSLHTRNCKDGPQLCRRCVHDRTQQLINPRFPQTVKPPGRPESQQTHRREFSDRLCVTTAAAAAARSPTPLRGSRLAIILGYF